MGHCVEANDSDASDSAVKVLSVKCALNGHEALGENKTNQDLLQER